MSEEAFGLQCPPPWMHLKRILANYPEGTSVFKEALQNADDAGASLFKMILDYRQLDDLSCEAFPDRFTGPALIFYNNGVFSDADWTSLRTMFQSHKLADAAEAKSGTSYIGKYGMGSRSFFHLTDLLMVVSGDSYAYIDPDEIISKAGGGKVTFTKKSNKTAACLKHLDCLLGVQGFDPTTAFKGTLIRLPLRLAAYARTSRFAPYEYDTVKTARLIRSFAHELNDCLLFLNNVCSIELSELRKTPREVHCLTSCTMRILEDTHQRAHSLQPDKHTWSSTIRRSGDSEKDAISERLVKFTTSDWTGEDLEIRDSFWLICLSKDLSNIIKKKPLNNCQPFLGIAMKLHPAPMPAEPGIFSDEFSNDRKVEHLDNYCWPLNENGAGQLFNYLPIPDVTPTGLPFHVHGSFHLTDNRRDIWLSTEAEGLAELWSNWNRSLLFEALPALLAHVFRKHFVKRAENPRIPADLSPLFRYWPDPAKLSIQLKPLIGSLAKSCLEEIPELKAAKFLRFADTTVNALLELKSIWNNCSEVEGVTQKDSTDSSKDNLPDLNGMLQALCIIASRSSKELVCAAPSRFYGAFNGAAYLSFLTVMYHHVLPHWLNNVGFNQLMLREKYYVPWMFILCQTLSGCSVEEIQRFASRCKSLRFVPCRTEANLPTLGVMPDEDWLDECTGLDSTEHTPLAQVTLRSKNQDWILLQPAAVYDSSLRTFKVTSGGIPAGPFSAPGISRVLRAWGMKPTLSWTDMTQELVLRICQNRP